MYFFQGSVSYEELMRMPIPELWDLHQQAERIGLELERKKG